MKKKLLIKLKIEKFNDTSAKDIKWARFRFIYLGYCIPENVKMYKEMSNKFIVPNE